MDHSSSDVVVVTRSKLWMHDGNVVLQAESMQFRVHQSMLARHSPVFDDMFSAPQPSHKPLTIDGCPIVHLSDSAEDMELVLTVLYDSNKTYSFSKKSLPFRLIGAMLRIGRKYEITHLRNESLRRLSKEFPTSSLEEYFKALSRRRGGIENYDRRKALILATENGVCTILPVVFYECLLLTEDALSELGLSWLTLLWTIVRGREEILNQLLQHTFAFLREDANIIPSHACISKKACIDALRILLIALWTPKPVPSFCIVPWDIMFTKAFLCPPCWTAAQTAHKAGIDAMWKKLPSFFGLPPWEELKDCE